VQYMISRKRPAKKFTTTRFIMGWVLSFDADERRISRY
jgi:hypothetical protein